MSREPEQILEDNLVKQLLALGYAFVPIKNENELLPSSKVSWSNSTISNFLIASFQKSSTISIKVMYLSGAELLRDKYQLTRDDGTSAYLDFLNSDNWSQNLFQVTQQVSIEGKYINRYDVTLLINGLPLVQVELKRRGLELKGAFNQTNRNQRHSYAASHGLFQFIQLFVISNGVNTKYYVNNRKRSFKFTFFRADNTFNHNNTHNGMPIDNTGKSSQSKDNETRRFRI